MTLFGCLSTTKPILLIVILKGKDLPIFISEMKKSFDIKLVKFYLWVALFDMILGMLFTWHNYPDRFFASLVNNVWGVAFLIVLNFIFFEYTVPYIFKKRNMIIYNILLGIFLLWVHMMFWSYGAYAWRLLGIQLHVYTALMAFPL